MGISDKEIIDTPDQKFLYSVARAVQLLARRLGQDDISEEIIKLGEKWDKERI